MEAKDFFYGLKTSIEIRKRYKRLAKQFHPDAAGEESTKKMQLIQQEYSKALRTALRSEGKTDADIKDILSQDNIDAINQMWDDAKNHSGGFFGFFNDKVKEVEKKLMEKAERGEDITAESGIDEAMKLIFGHNPLKPGQNEPAQLESGSAGKNEPGPDEPNEQDKKDDSDGDQRDAG